MVCRCCCCGYLLLLVVVVAVVVAVAVMLQVRLPRRGNGCGGHGCEGLMTVQLECYHG